MPTSKPHISDDLFAEAFACFEQGLCYDEIDDAENAMGVYERGLNLIKEAEKQKNYKKSELYKGITESRKKVEARLKDIKKRREKTKKSAAKVPKLESTDEKAPKPVDSSDEKSGTESETVKGELRKELETAGEGDAELIFFIPDGVQLFIIEGDETTVPTYPSPLEIFRFGPKTQQSSEVQAKAFMQVGPWAYPLIPGQTPVLKNEFGAYVVPNPTPKNPDMFVGIVLPADLDKQLEEDFFNLLKEYTEVRTQEVSPSLSHEERQRLSEKIAILLIKGGDKVAWGVNYTAEKTSQVIAEHTSKWRASMKASEEPMNISPAIQTSVHYIHRGSKIVAKCTRYLLDRIGDVGVAVGRQIASGAEKGFGGGKTGGVVSGTITVIGGGITSASTVWMALENASKALCRNIANETVDTVKLKYGEDASTTMHDVLYATGHSTLVAYQLYDFGPRSIAGRAARKAGVQFVKDLNDKHKGRKLTKNSP